MKTITMTEFNQRVSAVTREAIARGEAVRVTNRGRVVLRLVPEQRTGSLDELIASGLATSPSREHRKIGKRVPVVLSRSIDELIDDVSSDVDI